jgi:predicted MFS family arabinose efflux permease
VASYLLGTISVTPQLVVPYAAGMAPAERRGRTVGAVMSGLLVGILLSRTLSGAVGAHAGWRAVYWLACGLMLVLSGVLAMLLPRQHPTRRISYGELLRSLPPLLAREPVLRRHAIVGALGFAAFSAFWTTLSFHLAALPEHYGSQTAGLFGLVGAAGAGAAIVAGRLADRIGPRPLNGVALGVAALSFGVMAAAGSSLLWLAVGVVGMDAGVQGSQISNQARIYALAPELRNRLNSVYIVCYFLGGASGSALGSQAWTLAGWRGVCVLGMLLCAGGIAALFVTGNATAAEPSR